MHLVSEAEWRRLCALVSHSSQALESIGKGLILMSTATAALKQDVADLSAKFDQFIANKATADAAALAADEADIAEIKADIDALSAKIDAAMPVPASPEAGEQERAG